MTTICEINTIYFSAALRQALAVQHSLRTPLFLLLDTLPKGKLSYSFVLSPGSVEASVCEQKNLF